MLPECSEIITEIEFRNFHNISTEYILFEYNNFKNRVHVFYTFTLLSMFLVKDSWPTGGEKVGSSTGCVRITGLNSSVIMIQPRLKLSVSLLTTFQQHFLSKVQPFAVLKTHPVFVHLFILLMFVSCLKVRVEGTHHLRAGLHGSCVLSSLLCQPSQLVVWTRVEAEQGSSTHLLALWEKYRDKYT